MSVQTIRKSSPLAIALAWFIVVVPTAWGLTYTVQNALKIFTSAPASAAPAAAPAPAPAPAPR